MVTCFFRVIAFYHKKHSHTNQIAHYNKKLFARSTPFSIMAHFRFSSSTEVDRALVALPDFKSGVAG